MQNMSTFLQDKRKNILSALLALCLSSALVSGYQLEKHDTLRFGVTGVLVFAALAAALFFVILYLMQLTERKAAFFFATGESSAAQEASPAAKSLRRYFLKVWSALLLCQLPVFLGVFPGFFCYDAHSELDEVLMRSFSTHHPLLHVLLLGGTIAAVHYVSGSWNAGIAVYTLLQMLLICAVFAAVITYLLYRGVRRGWRIFALVFFGLFPPVVMYTLCSSKDSLFSAFFLLTVLLLLDWHDDAERFFAQKKKPLLFAASCALMMLMRHNGLYAYAVFLPFAVFLLTEPAFRKKTAALLVLPLLTAYLLNTLLAAALHAEPPHNQEKLTVPIMQLARLEQMKPEAFSPEELETLYRYLSKDALDLYDYNHMRVSDQTKHGFNNPLYEEDALSFWRLWLSKGLSHPATYLNAWYLTSYGFWYPFAVINVYQGNRGFTFAYEESSYFAWETEAPGERMSLLPPVDALYRTLSLDAWPQKTPLLSLLFAPASYAWITGFVFFYLLASKEKKQRKRSVLLLLPVLNFLTVLLGPTYLVRYVICLFFCLPLLPLFLRDSAGV